MENKLLTKYLLPYYLASVLFIGTAGAATFFAKKEIQMAKTHAENKQIVDSCKSSCFLCLFIFILSIIMSVSCGIKYPQVVRKKAKIMTKHYLQDIFTRHPEMRQYRYILEDSRKVHEIAAVICNGLTENEQTAILDFVKEELSAADNKYGISQIQKIEYMIIDIVQAHAARDPEYKNKILSAIANVQKVNFIETAQKVR